MSRGMYLFLGLVQLAAGALVMYDGISDEVVIRIFTGICFLFAGICNLAAWRRTPKHDNTEPHNS